MRPIAGAIWIIMTGAPVCGHPSCLLKLVHQFLLLSLEPLVDSCNMLELLVQHCLAGWELFCSFLNLMQLFFNPRYLCISYNSMLIATIFPLKTFSGHYVTVCFVAIHAFYSWRGLVGFRGSVAGWLGRVANCIRSFITKNRLPAALKPDLVGWAYRI